MQRPNNAIVIHSPYSGRSAQLSQALTFLQEAGLTITQVMSIATLDDQPAQGSRWRESGADVAIAAGGDGLLGGVITHIAESSLPLGILPLGTANDIARSLRIPQDLRQAAEVIAQGNTQEVDIGVAQPAEQAPHLASVQAAGPVLSHVSVQKHGYFAHALTIGLNVQFALRLATNIVTRQRYGRMTYPFSALEVLRNHEALEVELHFDGLALPQQSFYAGYQQKLASDMEQAQAAPSSLRCRALQVAVINAPIFGGQWQLAVPGASIHDRLLDIVVIEDIEFGNLSSAIAQFFGPQKQTATPLASWREHFVHHPAELTGIPGMHHLQARGVSITTSDDPRDATLDGEVRGQTPMHVRLADQRLRVLAPR